MLREGEDIVDKGKIIGKVLKATDRGMVVAENGSKESLAHSEQMVDQLYINAYKSEVSEEDMFVCIFMRKAGDQSEGKQDGKDGEVMETHVVGRVNPKYSRAFLHAIKAVNSQLRGGEKEVDKREVDDMLKKVFEEIDDNKKS